MTVRDKVYDKQLLLLGACVASRELLDAVEPKDLASIELGAVLEELQLMVAGKTPGGHVQKFLRELGVDLGGRKIAQALQDEVSLDGRYERAKHEAKTLSLQLAGNQTSNRLAFIEELKRRVADL